MNFLCFIFFLCARESIFSLTPHSMIQQKTSIVKRPISQRVSKEPYFLKTGEMDLSECVHSTAKRSLFDRSFFFYEIKGYPNFVLEITRFSKDRQRNLECETEYKEELAVVTAMKNFGVKVRQIYGIVNIKDGHKVIGKGLVLQKMNNLQFLKGNAKLDARISLRSLEDFCVFVRNVRKHFLVIREIGGGLCIENNGEIFLQSPFRIEKNDVNDLMSCSINAYLKCIIELLKNQSPILGKEERIVLREIFSMLKPNKFTFNTILFILKNINSEDDSSWHCLIDDMFTVCQENYSHLKFKNLSNKMQDVKLQFYQELGKRNREKRGLKKKMAWNKRNWKELIVDFQRNETFFSPHVNMILNYLKEINYENIKPLEELDIIFSTDCLVFILKILLLQQDLENFYKQEIQEVSFWRKTWKFPVNKLKIVAIHSSQQLLFKKIKTIFDLFWPSGIRSTSYEKQKWNIEARESLEEIFSQQLGEFDIKNIEVSSVNDFLNHKVHLFKRSA